jgi:hypothetical protein
MMRWYPVAAAMRDITAVWVCVTRARAERTGRRAYRAADHRPRRGATAPAGNRTDSGARSGAYQPAANIDLCVRRRRREQRCCDATGRK